MKVLVAGDVGGSKTTLSLVEAGGDPRDLRKRESFVSSSFRSFADVVEAFLSPLEGIHVSAACFGVAGPVVDGFVELTNLGWRISESELATVLGTDKVLLINDLVAIASGIPLLEPADIRTVNPGKGVPHGTIGVIAPGTGLGEAFLTWEGSGYRAHPSEGGHADFAPADDIQEGLLAYLRQRYGHVSVERVCSGIGIPLIYAYLRDRLGYEEPDWLAQRVSSAKDPAIAIRETAQDPSAGSELCVKTMEVFVRILGAETGNLALKLLPTGGIYLAGGLPPRILPMLEGNTFLDAFAAKGRLSHVVRRIPVHVVMNTDVGLLGAAAHALRDASED